MGKHAPGSSRKGNRAARVEALALEIGHGPIHTGRIVLEHARRFKIAKSTAWRDHAQARAAAIQLSADRVAEAHSTMEAHLLRMLGRAEGQWSRLLDRHDALMDQAAEAEADERYQEAEDREAAAVRVSNAAANALRSMATLQARLMRLQGLGRPEALGDIVPTIVVYEGLPLPEGYEGPALGAESALVRAITVDGEFEVLE